MNYKTYEVKVWDVVNKEWRLNGKYHREDGPAITEWEDENKFWFLFDYQYAEEDWKQEVNKLKNPCNGKVVETDGKKYKLTEVE